VIQRYGILDSVVAMDKGSIVKTKNLLYDGETGEVVLSRTNNEFNDPVYNFSYPAHSAYSGMGPAYKNLDARFANLRLIKGKLYYGEPSIVPFPVERFFESGDEVILKGAYRTTFPGAGCLYFLPQTLGIKTVYFPLNKAWVIDASKGNNTKQGLYFMDSVGHMITGKVDSLRILRSGKRNMLDASVGSIVLMNNPIQSAGTGNYQLVLDSTSRVINTSAVTYKDFWQTENSLYAKDTVYKVYRTKTITLNPQQVTTKRLDIDFHNHIYEETTIPNSKNIAASFDYIPSRTCVNSRRLYTKSILTFDFSSIPEGATILDAEFYSTRRLPRDLWYQKFSGGGIFCPKTASFDWKNATSWYNGKDRVYLKRMLKPWKYTDSYLSSSLAASSVNAIYLNDTTWSGISCTSLIQDVINNGNYGLLFEIDKRTNTVDNYETNYLNLCAGNEPNVNHFNDSSCGNSHIITQPQCDCSAPSITITYTAVTDSAGTICKNYINDSITNPYKWGMLGNWRVDRAYTYYHDRKESDASLATTDIRKEGELKRFSSYWKFTASGLTANADTTKWVWNSASSIYNKKGFEIENYDPLGRYNAGLYGYNNTLPIAVAQNSRYRELLYDGFEDYNYSTKSCANCEPLREYDFVLNNTGVSLSNKESHTGRYSMKVTASSEAQITVPLVTTTTLGDADSLLISVDSTAITNTTVVGKGNGLTATYTGLPSSAGCSLGIRSGTSSVMKQAVEGPIDYLWSNTSPVPGMCQNYYDVTWKGKIQAPYTDNYRFFGWSDKVMQVYVNGVNVVNQQYPYLESAGPQISLQAGVLYDVVVKYSH
ncbi:MAG TPA: PA14 domain-containing protein, partial [Flavisolibacter sp.]|nr:PA14 domain-containing protein [Flavisolibacter sp.]